jgi:hypothetical protein
MANSTTAFGLRPLGKVSGNPANGGNDAFRIADNASTSVYQGDLVGLTAGNIVGTGYGIVHAAGNTNNGISGVYLDLGASTTAQLKIMSVSPFIGNEENVTNEDFVVKIKESSSIL